MSEIKMQFELLLKVKRSGRRTYLVVPAEISGNYRLEPEDLVRVEFKTLIRANE